MFAGQIRQSLWGCLLTVLWCGGLCPWAQAETAVDFEREVAPLLITRCLACHQAADPSGGLSLAREQDLRQGGESGPAVAAGQLDQSLLWRRVEAGEMPPAKKGREAQSKLTEAELRSLRNWIEQGAKWPAGRTLDLYERTTVARAGRDWWSLRPPVSPPLPVPPSGANFRNAIDLFISQGLAEAKLEPAPAASRRVLIRRLYADLVGLPPTAEEIEAFESDPDPWAYEALVDRLLAAPQFGERWARFWLDLARFAETCGYERDQEKPFAWKYRDWVVNAFNDDLRYDLFVRDQLSGDEVASAERPAVIGTGFLRLGTWNDEPNDPEEYKYDRLEDLVDVTSSAFLGLTVKCARCHEHKFDPIDQADYYRIANVFWPGPIEPRDGKWLGGPSPEEVGPDVLGWTDIRREMPPLHLLRKGDPRRPGAVVEPSRISFVADIEQPIGAIAAEGRTTRRRTQLADWILDPKNPLTARVIVNRLWQHHFGKGLVRTPSNFGFTGDRPSHPELLDWLATELVRHDWSLKHIHRLLVTSATYRQASVHPQPEAAETTDPENRRWWRMDRRRLDAESIRDAMLVVSGDLDLRRGGPSFRPTIAADALEGLSRKSAAWTASPPREQLRRSLYIFSQRSLLSPWMTTFDFADTTMSCPQRDVTIAAPQALALFNNEFSHARSLALARHVAARVAISLGNEDSADGNPASGKQNDRRHLAVEHAWRFVLARAPRETERLAAEAHLQAQEARLRDRPSSELPDGDLALAALASLCHVLFNTNEFAFVD